MDEWVFVWVGYGEADVYKADTLENLRGIAKGLNLVLDDLIEIDETKSVSGIRKDISAIVYNHVTERNFDSFDYGTGFVKLKTP